MEATTPSVASRTRLGAALVAFAALILSACLAPGEYDPTGNAPIGHLDLVEAAGSSIRVKGWAIDPNTTAPVNVTVSYLGRNSKHLANISRPDVAAAYKGYGSRHGFEVVTPSLGTGVKQVCVWVENVGAGTQARALGCKDVQLRSDNTTGKLESVTALSPTRVRITGWALDMETPASINVRYTIDGRPSLGAIANIPRPDVNWYMGIRGNHGFVIDATVTVGSHEICVRAPAVGRGSEARLGCKSVLTESVTPIGAGRDLLSVGMVGPVGTNPLAGMDRDAGVSTVLSDGSVLWIFGDTTGWNPNGTVRYFLNNTAGWATAAKPTITTDGVASGNVPFQFMTPVGPFASKCPTAWKAVLWPLSAVTVPVDANRDRVVVFFGDVCLGGEWEMHSRGVGVAEWIYDSRTPPAGKGITGRILTQNLFPQGLEYGTAAHYDGTYILAYQCGRPADSSGITWPDDEAYGPCTVGRVAPGTVGDIAAWEFWAGENAWVKDRTLATPMVVPGIGTHKQMPVASFGVVDDPIHGYLMVYSPWPGIGDEVAVRRSESPLGPWTEPVIYKLPGCKDSAKSEERYCYAATPQPSLSTVDRIGIGYFDQLVALRPARGGYLAGTVAAS